MSSNNSYKDSLNLPRTDFSIRANAKETEPAIRKRWAVEQVDEKTYIRDRTKAPFIMHDGPPYSNGNIHMGTTCNKVLKDIVCKYKRMTGHYAPFKPGWDCHGLPIEFKVLKEGDFGDEVDPVALKKACRSTAQKWINVQKEQFKELGVLAKWSDPYFTMSPQYEATVIRSFGSFVEKGYITRKLKTIPWCFSCQTALATAEIEYHERKDPSCYVLFGIADEIMQELFVDLMLQRPGLQAHFLVWTTTPWTIPLNRAVVLNPTADYVLLALPEGERAFIVGSDRADDICAMLGIEKNVLATFKSEIFNGQYALHPLVKNLTVSVLHDTAVTTQDGTACMHMAPGCGPEDYLIARKNDIEVYSPLAADGTYTDAIRPHELAGMSITDGQIWVMRALKEQGALLHKTSLRHSYPHCWRCRNGLMFRATEQWFCDLSQQHLTDRAVTAMEEVSFIPENGRARLQATVGARSEWCISRQRYWGTPIVALLCNTCDTPYLDSALINGVANHVAEQGIEYWDQVTIAELMQEGILDNALACHVCDNESIANFRKETDILDVWFDSGLSHKAVLEPAAELSKPADLYLEGTDQHRGWFQSSFLTGMALDGAPPMRAILTHGYVVDGSGKKMSKSLGNTVAPSEVIEKYSADILRLWVASVDYSGDMVISDTLLKNVAEVYRKIRNTTRFLLSNLYDFNADEHQLDFDELLALDQYALERLHEVISDIQEAYERYQIQTVYQLLSSYCASDLSAFFLDIMKDRLYCDVADGHARRSAQTVCYAILDALTRVMAPILSYLAEEASDHFIRGKEQSIHLHEWVPTISRWRKRSSDYAVNKHAQWQALIMVRDAVLKALEEVRATGKIKHSLEAQVTIYIDAKAEQGAAVDAFFTELADAEAPTEFFKSFCIVSQVTFAENVDGLGATALEWAHVHVSSADGIKCPRCWQFDTQASDNGLCRRCQPIVG